MKLVTLIVGFTIGYWLGSARMPYEDPYDDWLRERFG